MVLRLLILAFSFAVVLDRASRLASCTSSGDGTSSDCLRISLMRGCVICLDVRNDSSLFSPTFLKPIPPSRIGNDMTQIYDFSKNF